MLDVNNRVGYRKIDWAISASLGKRAFWQDRRSMSFLGRGARGWCDIPARATCKTAKGLS